MKIFKIYSLFLFINLSLFATIENRYPNMAMINSKVKIIDIRAEGEWYETGILKGSYPITFFNSRGEYNISDFLGKLNRVVKKGEKFALICRSGSRTTTVAKFLSRNGYNVINLTGGILYSIKKLGMRTVKYSSSQKVR